jgi:hypothetical protein
MPGFRRDDGPAPIHRLERLLLLEFGNYAVVFVHATESKSLFHDVDTMKSGCRGYKLKVPKSVPYLCPQ